jgi:parallel beta-helix repeat protein
MNQIDSAPKECEAATPRRDFLRTSLLLAVPAALGGTAFSAVASTFNPPSRARGDAHINVRDFGARGNGDDDTRAIQRAIDALPPRGGTVYVPAGTYMIDAERSIRLRPRMHLKLDPDAKLVAKPTSNPRYNVVLADNVYCIEISGGQIIGERDQHRGTGGEGGHGIRIRGSKWVTIRDIRISNGWGDGITVGPKPVWRKPYIMSDDVVVANVVCTGNRRNAMSIGNVKRMRVYDSEFSNTHGTKPECGIDVEPDAGINDDGYCDDVRIENCLFRNNAKMGLMMWRRAQGVTVRNCTMEHNGVCGIFTEGAQNVELSGNTVRENKSTGCFIRKENKNVEVRGNTFYNNYTKQGIDPRADFSMVGVDRSVRKDLIIGDPRYGNENIRVGRNWYR